MARRIILLTFLLSGFGAIAVFAQSPFTVSAVRWAGESGEAVAVSLHVPEGHFVYADSLRVSAPDGEELIRVGGPASVPYDDPFSDGIKQVYREPVRLLFAMPEAGDLPARIVVDLQGCTDEICFFPETHRFDLDSSGVLSSPPDAITESAVLPLAERIERDFTVRARASGFLKVPDFLAFLDESQAGVSREEGLLSRSRSWGIGLTLLFILLGGLALNLTPCVLPLIPVNLAIIGAGAQSGSTARGFLLGAAYGLAMAVAYGALGLVAVLGNVTFGALNTSALFNALIALVFVALALAMFDIVHIDFSRWQGRMNVGRSADKRGHFALAFGMGALAALLAGACVAPVVIFVLLLAANLYAQGHAFGLALPFVLGLGMGLPWPFAGAGLSFLPKPGAWMRWVKAGFGVVILALAAYYGHLAWSLFSQQRIQSRGEADAAESSNRALELALNRSAESGREVFVDFWATWCKNCKAMEATTFKDADVEARLERYIVVKYQAETPDLPPARDVIQALGVKGLPTYVILAPR